MREGDWWERYDGVRQRVTALVIDDERALLAPLPTCPGWSGRELLSHLVGLAQDVGAGCLDGYASEAWTANQVERGATQTVDELLDAWPAAARGIRGSAVGGVPAPLMAFGDALVHEADLRDAVPTSHPIPDDDVVLGVKTGIARWREVLATAGAPTLRIAVVDQRDWWLGDRDVGPVTTLEVDHQELFRLLYGRRSLAQARALTWSRDPTPFLTELPYPFRWAEREIGR